MPGLSFWEAVRRDRESEACFARRCVGSAAVPSRGAKVKPGRGTEGPAGQARSNQITSCGRLLLPLLLALLAEQLHHSRVRRVRDLLQHQQVVAAEAAGALPLFFLRALGSLGGDVEPRPVVAFVPPDRGLDAADADFLDRLNFVQFLRPARAPLPLCRRAVARILIVNDDAYGCVVVRRHQSRPRFGCDGPVHARDARRAFARGFAFIPAAAIPASDCLDGLPDSLKVERARHAKVNSILVKGKARRRLFPFRL